MVCAEEPRMGFLSRPANGSPAQTDPRAIAAATTSPSPPEVGRGRRGGYAGIYFGYSAWRAR